MRIDLDLGDITADELAEWERLVELEGIDERLEHLLRRIRTALDAAQ